MTVLMIILTLVVGVQTILVIGLLRSHAEILRTLHDLGRGDESTGHSHTIGLPTPAPRRSEVVAAPISGLNTRGGATTVAVGGVEHATVLAFLSSGCLSCKRFWDDFAAGAPELPGATRLVIVTKGPEAESESMIRDLAPASVPTIMSSQAWSDYSVPATPYFVLVDGPTGAVVGEGAASNWPHVLSLLARGLADAGLAEQREPRAAMSEEPSRIDRDLSAAGIVPGHPSLYPEAEGGSA